MSGAPLRILYICLSSFTVRIILERGVITASVSLKTNVTLVVKETGKVWDADPGLRTSPTYHSHSRRDLPPNPRLAIPTSVLEVTSFLTPPSLNVNRFVQST